MSLLITITGAKSLGPNLWEARLPPQRVRQLGGSPTSVGQRSVLFLSDFIFSEKEKELTFEFDAITPINIGTSDKVIVLGSTVNEDQMPETPISSECLGKGDQEFLNLCEKELSADMFHTAKLLLTEVRRVSSGELKRGTKKNFSETPDNFWYVVVQNRIDQLQITVRGPVEHFAQISALELKDDRGNTRFKVKAEADIGEALKLILHAIRKPR